ncbi:centromere protein R isoform 2-T3 [Trichechus inunguis]
MQWRQYPPNHEMRAKRSLRLEGLLEENSLGPSKIQRKKSIATYSPTTGTCQMSPFASPTSSKEQEHRNGPSNGKKEKLNNLNSRLTERKEPRTNDNDERMLIKRRENVEHNFKFSWNPHFLEPLRLDGPPKLFPEIQNGRVAAELIFVNYLYQFMMLWSKVEKSSEEIMEIMQNLSSIQALKGRKELENLIGISCASSFLQREMQKTKELMRKVTKQRLFEKRSTGLPNKVRKGV